MRPTAIWFLLMSLFTPATVRGDRPSTSTSRSTLSVHQRRRQSDSTGRGDRQRDEKRNDRDFTRRPPRRCAGFEQGNVQCSRNAVEPGDYCRKHVPQGRRSTERGAKKNPN